MGNSGRECMRQVDEAVDLRMPKASVSDGSPAGQRPRRTGAALAAALATIATVQSPRTQFRMAALPLVAQSGPKTSTQPRRCLDLDQEISRQMSACK